MITFKQYFEETNRVYNLTGDEELEVHKIIDKYFKTFSPDSITKYHIISQTPEKYFQNKIDSQKRLFLGNISYIDNQDNKVRKCPVYVSFKRNTRRRGEYHHDVTRNGEIVNYINLFYFRLKLKKYDVEDVLVHELFHAKQPYKIPRKGYNPHIKRRYYYDPVEVHNITSTIIRYIENEFRKGDPNKNRDLVLFLKVFAQSGNMLPEPIPVPEFLRDKEDFIKTLYRNRNNPKEPRYRKEYKRFYSKIYSLYNDLQNKVQVS